MTYNRPRQLPTMRHKGKLYFIDLRLRELRTVLPPLEFVPFDSALGREIDEMPGPEEDECLTGYDTVIICPHCGATLFEGTESEAKRLIIHCVDCAEKN
jgi:hypothetical protein